MKSAIECIYILIVISCFLEMGIGIKRKDYLKIVLFSIMAISSFVLCVHESSYKYNYNSWVMIPFLTSVFFQNVWFQAKRWNCR